MLPRHPRGFARGRRRKRQPAPKPRLPGAASGAAKAGGKTPNLDQYTVNLTENARKGKIDPVLGRDFEIRQMVDILTRRRQNNPILTGEAGVGKTAVVEGFALRIAQGDVPPPLWNVTVRTLDLALLQAGAGIKGEFENRLKGLIEEVKSSPTPIILFIDEAHTMIGAGGAGRPERRGQPAEAGAGARRTAHHRRHHLVRIQEVFREGPRAGAALPGGEGGRAHRSASAMVMLRGIVPVAGEASQRAHSGRGLVRRGQALAPLSAGPPAARQSGQRARYRLRAPRPRPERDAAAPSKMPPARSTIAPCRSASSSAKPPSARTTPKASPSCQTQDRGGSSPDGIERALGERARPGEQDPRSPRQAGTAPAAPTPPPAPAAARRNRNGPGRAARHRSAKPYAPNWPP